MTMKKEELMSTAVSLLARREHGEYELSEKLRIKQLKTEDASAAEAVSHGLVSEVLKELKQKNWQSDERYAASFVRTRFAAGKGPRSIEHELRQKRIDNELIARTFKDAECDWFELAVDVARKKLGGKAMDKKNQERLYRFLVYRGFDSEQSSYALGVLKRSGNDT